MDIGAIGWWSYENQGDLAMLSALRQGLAPHRVVAIDTGFSAHPDTIQRLNRLDHLLLGGGTLIPGKPVKPFNTFDQWAEHLEVPLGVVGLGVDPFPERHWPAVEALLDRAEFFDVRDRASRTLLRNHPRVQVTPDLTFAYPLPAREHWSGDSPAAPVCGVNLRGTASFDPAPWMEVLARLPVQLRGVPFITFDEFHEGALLRELDPDTPRSFDADLYRQLDLMIATAFHAVLFSVQAAVPVIAIEYAPKVRSFMEDNGLARYLLAPDQHARLPDLVDEMLAKRTEIATDLRATRGSLLEEAQQNMERIRAQIEQAAPRRRQTGPKVTVVVMGSGDAEADERTLASCRSQTYGNAEVLSTRQTSTRLAAPSDASQVKGTATGLQAGYASRLQEAITSAEGEYLTWVEGGDWFADDALDCLVACLEQNEQWDVVYADYYAISRSNLPLGYHTVPGQEKLFRRDVVGPCFLIRRTLLARLGLPLPDTPLVAYSLWLQAGSSSVLAPFHAPIFYSTRQIRARAIIEQERQVRRHWRKIQPAWSRALWRIIDTDLGERLVVQPLARLRNLLGRVHARGS